MNLFERMYNVGYVRTAQWHIYADSRISLSVSTLAFVCFRPSFFFDIFV